MSASIQSISFEEYAKAEGGSFHQLLDSCRSPAHAKARRSLSEAPTPEMIRGQAIHCLTWEPDAFASRFVLASCVASLKSGPRKGEPCQATASSCGDDGRWYCGTHAPENPVSSSVVPLKVDVWDLVHRAADSVRLDPVAKPIIDSCPNREQSIFFTLSGIKWKARPDCFGKHTIADLKCIADWHEDDFPRFIANQKPDWQLAIYESACRQAGVIEELPDRFIIAVAPDGEHEVRVYEFDDAMQAEAWEAMQSPLARYRACVERGEWPSGPGCVLQAVRAKWDKTDVLDVALD